MDQGRTRVLLRKLYCHMAQQIQQVIARSVAVLRSRFRRAFVLGTDDSDRDGGPAGHLLHRPSAFAYVGLGCDREAAKADLKTLDSIVAPGGGLSPTNSTAATTTGFCDQSDQLAEAAASGKPPPPMEASATAYEYSLTRGSMNRGESMNRAGGSMNRVGSISRPPIHSHSESSSCHRRTCAGAIPAPQDEEARAEPRKPSNHASFVWSPASENESPVEQSRHRRSQSCNDAGGALTLSQQLYLAATAKALELHSNHSTCPSATGAFKGGFNSHPPPPRQYGHTEPSTMPPKIVLSHPSSNHYINTVPDRHHTHTHNQNNNQNHHRQSSEFSDRSLAAGGDCFYHSNPPSGAQPRRRHRRYSSEAAPPRPAACFDSQQAISEIKQSRNYLIYRQRYPPGHHLEIKTPRSLVVGNVNVGLDRNVINSWGRTIDSKARGAELLNLLQKS